MYLVSLALFFVWLVIIYFWGFFQTPSLEGTVLVTLLFLLAVIFPFLGLLTTFWLKKNSISLSNGGISVGKKFFSWGEIDTIEISGIAYEHVEKNLLGAKICYGKNQRINSETIAEVIDKTGKKPMFDKSGVFIDEICLVTQNGKRIWCKTPADPGLFLEAINAIGKGNLVKVCREFSPQAIAAWAGVLLLFVTVLMATTNLFGGILFTIFFAILFLIFFIGYLAWVRTRNNRQSHR
jgi:hypothetical protein